MFDDKVFENQIAIDPRTPIEHLEYSEKKCRDAVAIAAFEYIFSFPGNRHFQIMDIQDHETPPDPHEMIQLIKYKVSASVYEIK